MRKLNCILAFALVIVFLLAVVHIISAQQQGAGQGQQQRGQRQRQPGQQQRRQVDPEEMMNRMMDRVLEQLNLSAEETVVLKPMIEGVLRTRMEQSNEMQELIGALREAIDAKDSGQIKAKLAEVKAKRKEHKAKAEALEKQLVELLTVEQEAQLTVSGVVNSDGTGFRFGGFRGQMPRDRRGGQQQQ